MTDMHDGKWIAIPSQDTERFHLGEAFDTREEAEDFARGEMLGAVAKLVKFKAKHAADYVDAERLLTEIDELACEDEWTAEDSLMDSPSQEAADDLQELIAAWIEKHDLLGRPWYQVVDTYDVREK